MFHFLEYISKIYPRGDKLNFLLLLINKISMKLSSKKLFGDNIKDFSLLSHQVPAIEWMRLIEYWIGYYSIFKGGVLGDSMGLGKTRDASAVIAASIVPFTLVMCPPTTRYAWLEELLACNNRVHVFTVEDDKYVHLTLKTLEDGSTDIDHRILNKKKGESIVSPCVLVCNYQLVASGTKNDKLITSHVWDRIIVDEAHFLRSENATWNKLNQLKQPMTVTNGITHRLGSRWCITGTPIQMIKYDLVNIFRFCDDRFLRGKTAREWDDELRFLISTRLFRRSSNQLTPYMKEMMRFPVNDPIIHNINIKVNDTQLSQQLQSLSYEQLEYACRTDYESRISQRIQGPCLIDSILADEKSFLIVLTTEAKFINSKSSSGAFIESEQFRNMFSFPYATVPMFFDRIRPGGVNIYKGEMSKVDAFKKIIIDKLGESFVVFHHYENIAKKLDEIINQNFPRYTVLKINGTVTSDRERYNTIKRANALIALGEPVILLSSMMATSEGANYQKFNNMISVDFEYNYKTQEQAKSRLQRIGQVNVVDIYEICLEDFQGFYGNISVDKRIKDIRDEREHIADIIDLFNAAWTFRRFYFTNPNGQKESGVYFDESFERIPHGTTNGPDSFGPLWIK